MADEIKKLIEGNKQFKQKFFHDEPTLFNQLAQEGQKPKILVVTCSDSRIDPAMMFNCQPGQLFVVRNVANLIPPCEDSNTYHGTSAALEFGVCFLEIKHIIVLGHTQCGGIQALIARHEKMTDKQTHSFIAKWMELARPAYTRVVTDHAQVALEEKMVLCEQYAIINSLRNLTSFPWIQERVAQKRLSLHGWYFDLATGFVHQYDQHDDVWFVDTHI